MMTKLLSLVSCLTKGLLALIIDETGSKFLVVFIWGFSRSFVFVKVVSTLFRYLHSAKLEYKLFTRHVVPRSFKCNPL